MPKRILLGWAAGLGAARPGGRPCRADSEPRDRDCMPPGGNYTLLSYPNYNIMCEIISYVNFISQVGDHDVENSVTRPLAVT